MPRHAQLSTEFDATRERILHEATRIVGRVGLNGLSMRALGEGVGLTPGALYRYFPSKQDLLWSMWQSALADLRTGFAACAKTEDPLSAIRCMLAAYTSFALHDLDRFRALFLENDQGGLNLLDRDPDALAPYQGLRAAVEHARSCGAVRPGDVDRLTQILWAAAHGALTLVVTVPEIDFGDHKAFVSDTIDTVLKGLGPAEDRHD